MSKSVSNGQFKNTPKTRGLKINQEKFPDNNQ